MLLLCSYVLSTAAGIRKAQHCDVQGRTTTTLGSYRSLSAAPRFKAYAIVRVLARSPADILMALL
jgi:hypothetical protein